MLSDYIVHRFHELIEKTYYKLVLVLAIFSIFSIVLSGLSLFGEATLRYFALITSIMGFIIAKIILNRLSKKIRKLLSSPERELKVKRYLQILKDVYIPSDYLLRISTEPKVLDPLTKSEKKRLEAGLELLKSKYLNLETRIKIVYIATLLAVILPHIIVTKDFIVFILTLILILSMRKN